MKQFRDDNTEGYSAADLDTLNEAFEAAFEAEPIALDADPDFISDMRQRIGEQIEAAWMPGRSVADTLSEYGEARTRYHEWLATRAQPQPSDMPDTWFAFTAFNTETLYGWGDAAEAEQMAAILNQGREVNLYYPEEVTDPELLARFNDSTGFNMADELIEHANRDED
jgi:hypothetical protein